ncbi:hypothetical protein N9Y89_02430 [bacterium]|nr:hypothetical protein [bacterium]
MPLVISNSYISGAADGVEIDIDLLSDQLGIPSIPQIKIIVELVFIAIHIGCGKVWRDATIRHDAKIYFDSERIINELEATNIDINVLDDNNLVFFGVSFSSDDIYFGFLPSPSLFILIGFLLSFSYPFYRLSLGNCGCNSLCFFILFFHNY